MKLFQAWKCKYPTFFPRESIFLQKGGLSGNLDILFKKLQTDDVTSTW